MNFNELLKKDYVMLDGAMGTMLQKSGLELGAIPELLGITNPELIINIHKEYIKAGAQIIYTNTFGANCFKLENTEFSVEEVIKAAVNNAKIAADEKALVALDLGPTGKLLEPSGELSFEEAYDAYCEQVLAGNDADVIVIETMTDLQELRAALLAAKENSRKPVMCTMTFEENMRTFAGCSVSSFAIVAEGLGADAIGINCSLGPVQLVSVAEELRKYTSLPLIVKPNAGLPVINDRGEAVYPMTAEDFGRCMKKLQLAGASVLGGCCGTDPSFISPLRNLK